ncbi:AraC family transcriptional regulator [Pseudonocardia eucalypti]|uniref:AraC family transcriptional regulator n=1 Tax=Pseudonocardia eucalypti TaxID=648755 RepID=A0ABP9QT68_9PSEU|nr:AraC-like DNA-binding protein [Pseudonocardia eucalypti]
MEAIPASFVLAAAGIAARKGWDVPALLRAAEVAPAQFVAPRPEITGDQLIRLVRACWRQTNDDLLGLGSRPVPPGTLRMICFAMASAPDVEAAIARLRKFGDALPGLSPISLSVDGELATLTIDTGRLDDPDHFLTVLHLIAAHRVIGWATGRSVPPRRVELPFPTPPHAADLELVFGQRPRFGAPTATLVLPREILRAPIVRTEEAMLAFLETAPADLLLNRPADSVSQLVRRAVERGVRDRDPVTAARLAEQLAMSEPTLRRRLREEGTSLREIRDEVLRAAAIASLERGQEPIAALAVRLGFSEPSAFTRAFRRWTGRSPLAYRRGA